MNLSEGVADKAKASKVVRKLQKAEAQFRKTMYELDKVLNKDKVNKKLSTELKMKSEDYWKNTHKALTKISERLVKMANKVGNLK